MNTVPVTVAGTTSPALTATFVCAPVTVIGAVSPDALAALLIPLAVATFAVVNRLPEGATNCTSYVPACSDVNW